ncbi:MAG: RNA polymerase sigma factor [Phototrophicales bacterium]|nr:MAG: RNA polymerase sigma factor [Phototrophicales bacterium]
MKIERDNEQWLTHLRNNDTLQQAAAIEDLQDYLQRGIYYYLSRERSDLSSYPSEELKQMAQDFAQDAILRILDNLDSFRGDSRFTTWAMKIGTRTAISELRRARYKDFSLDDLTADGELMVGLDRSDPNQVPPITPEQFTERNDVMKILGSALNEALTDRQRAALEAVVLKGIPIDVVADQLDTNRNALYKLLHDARKKLRNHLEQQGVQLEYIMRLFEN